MDKSITATKEEADDNLIHMSKKMLVLGAVSACIVGALAAGAAYLYVHRGSSAAHSGALENSHDILARAGQIVDLPLGENAQIAPVTDIEKLRSNPFFVRAKNGDVLIVYVQSRFAILLDPKTGKVVNMSRMFVVLPKI